MPVSKKNKKKIHWQDNGSMAFSKFKTTAVV